MYAVTFLTKECITQTCKCKTQTYVLYVSVLHLHVCIIHIMSDNVCLCNTFACSC